MKLCTNPSHNCVDHLQLELSEVITSWRNFFEKFARDKAKFSEEDFKTTLNDFGVQVTRDDRKRWFALLDVTCDGYVSLNC